MSRVPDRLVEKVHLGVATAAERTLVEGDPDARARLAALPVQDAAFFAAHPVDPTVRAIEARARVAAARDDARARRTPLVGMLAAPLALAAAALLFVTIASESPVDEPLGADPELEHTTAKGAPRLTIYRQRDDRPERLQTGAVAVPGDTLQLEVLGAGARNGVIVSVDGRGAVTLHWPEKQDGPTKMKTGQHRLDHAYLLDDAPKYERFFLVTSDGPADVPAVVRAAEALASSGHADTASLHLPANYEQTSTFVRKVNP